ncbi:hypothetical protein Tco_0486232, partial [Tanacetum coccineum]
LNEKKNRIADDEETRLDQSTMDAGDVSDVPVNTSDTNNVTVEKKEFKSAYASIAKSNILDNKLTLIPIEICEDGIKVVIFEDEIVKEESKK